MCTVGPAVTRDCPPTPVRRRVTASAATSGEGHARPKTTPSSCNTATQPPAGPQAPNLYMLGTCGGRNGRGRHNLWSRRSDIACGRLSAAHGATWFECHTAADLGVTRRIRAILTAIIVIEHPLIGLVLTGPHTVRSDVYYTKTDDLSRYCGRVPGIKARWC